MQLQILISSASTAAALRPYLEHCWTFGGLDFDYEWRGGAWRLAAVPKSAIGDRGQTATVVPPHLLFAENPAYEIGGVFCAKFLHDIGTVEFDAARTDAERPRGFFAGRTAHDLSQRYALPRRQRVMAHKRF